MTASVRQAVNSLIKDHNLLYSLAEWLESQHQDFPQITAERLRDRLLFDQVAVLLKTDEGLDLAGCVGWRPNGVGPVEHYDQSILNKLGGNGARLIGPADRRELLNAGLLGNEAKTIVAAPLEHENVAFGVLLVGQEEPNSEAPQGNGSFDGIGSFARSVAPDLHAWLLLRGLVSNWRPAAKRKSKPRVMRTRSRRPRLTVNVPRQLISRTNTRTASATGAGRDRRPTAPAACHRLRGVG